MTTQELRPIAGPCSLAPVEVGKGHTATEFTIPGVAREQSPRFRVDLSDDEGGRGTPRHAKHPLDIRRHRERLGRPERFSIVRREILIGSSSGTNSRRSSEIPCDVCSKRL